MTQSDKDHQPDGLRKEYDFSGGVRGKHASSYAMGTNVVVLDPDVSAKFPNASAVNKALRSLSVDKELPQHGHA